VRRRYAPPQTSSRLKPTNKKFIQHGKTGVSKQTGETKKNRPYSKARREKASALTRLRIAFFLAAGGLLLQSYGVFLSFIPLLSF